jgi:hypothetical protein
MSNEQKQTRYTKFHIWLASLSYIGVLITLFLIVVQIFYAKQTMVEANEWEKAKVTMENIERFRCFYLPDHHGVCKRNGVVSKCNQGIHLVWQLYNARCFS